MDLEVYEVDRIRSHIDELRNDLAQTEAMRDDFEKYGVNDDGYKAAHNTVNIIANRLDGALALLEVMGLSDLGITPTQRIYHRLIGKE